MRKLRKIQKKILKISKQEKVDEPKGRGSLKPQKERTSKRKGLAIGQTLLSVK